MTERFEQGRRALDDIDPPADLWQRVEQRASDTEARPPGPGRGSDRRGGRSTLVAAAVVLFALTVGGIAFALGSGDDGRVSTTPASGSDDPTEHTSAATAPVAAVAIPLGSPCETVTIAAGEFEVRPGPSMPPLFGDGGTVPGVNPDAHGMAGAVAVDINVPGMVVRDLVGEQVEEVEFRRGTAQLWITSRFSQLRWFPGGQDPCRSFTVTASRGTRAEQRAAAIETAERIVLPTDDPAPEAGSPATSIVGDGSDPGASRGG